MEEGILVILSVYVCMNMCACKDVKLIYLDKNKFVS